MRLAALALILISGRAEAASLLFTGSSGTLSASAMFELTPGDETGTVTVTLTNAAGPSSQALVPADLLTAVYFNLTGGAAVTPFSAVVPVGQKILPEGNDAGAFWQYKTNIENAALRGAHSGISSTGLGIFGPKANFGCSPGCQQLDGLNYGIVPKSYIRGDGNSSVEAVPVIQYSAVFTLQGAVPQNASVDSVWFQYGTDLSEPSFGPGGEVPEPSPAILVGCGLLLAGLSQTLRKRLRRGL